MENVEKLKKQYELLRAQVNVLEEQKNRLENFFGTIERIKRSVEEIDEGRQIQFSLHDLVFVESRIVSKKFLVNIGGNTFVKVDKKDVLNFLEKRKNKIANEIEKIEKIQELYLKKMEEIVKEIVKHSKAKI